MSKLAIGCTAFLLLASWVLCQSSDDSSVAERIVRAALADGQAYETLGELCAAAPRRLSGSPEAAAAVEFTRQRLESYGLDAVRLEACTVPHWVRGRIATLSVVSPADRAAVPLPILALGGSVATPIGGVEAEVVEVASLGQVRALGESAKGKIVFYNQAMDPTRFDTFDAYSAAVGQRVRGAIEAAKLGAVAVVVRSMTLRSDDHPHTGSLAYEEATPKIPAAAVSTLGADRLSGLIERVGRVVLRLELDCRTLLDEPSFNVVAELRGREKPDEIVVVGGHLDSWDVAEGAHDDGAGCAQSMEVLRLLKSLELRPRRTIRCVLFMNEENGLRGALAYRDAHKDEMSKHIAAIESDRGGFLPRGFSTDAAGEGFAVLSRHVKRLENFGISMLLPGGGGADISPMKAFGVPLIGLLPDSQRYFDHHHAATDVFASVNERELELGAGVLAALAYAISEEPEPLPRNKIPESRRSD